MILEFFVGRAIRATPPLSLRHPGYAEYQSGRPWPVVRADILTFGQDV